MAKWFIYAATAVLLCAVIQFAYFARNEGTGYQETSEPSLNGITDPIHEEGAESAEMAQKETAPASWEKEYFREVGDYMDDGPAADDAQEADGGAKAGLSRWQKNILYSGQVLAGLLVVCALILLLGKLGKKYGKRSPLLAGRHYGEVLAKVHLSPRAALHYVRSGGRVLVIGVTHQSINLITEFDEGAFEMPAEPEPLEGEPGLDPGTFLAQLRRKAANMRDEPQVRDDDINALRGDLQRLQEHLREGAREPDLR